MMNSYRSKTIAYHEMSDGDDHQKNLTYMSVTSSFLKFSPISSYSHIFIKKKGSEILIRIILTKFLT